MIIKVKEPLKSEYSLIKEGQIIYTYFHFASSLELTNAMVDSKSICIAYETVENYDKSLPLLTPMSEVAGRMAAQQGAKFLEKHQKGCGILLGGVPGVSPAKAIVLGGGVVGTQSAKMLAGLGADVTILDIDTEDSIIGSPNSNTNISEEKEFIFVTKFREIIFRLRKWSCILVCFNLVFLFLMVVVFE